MSNLIYISDTTTTATRNINHSNIQKCKTEKKTVDANGCENKKREDLTSLGSDDSGDLF